MATHSSIPTWKSPWTGEPGGLQSTGLHDWAHVHEGGGRCDGSSKLVELKKKKKAFNSRLKPFIIEEIACILQGILTINKGILKKEKTIHNHTTQRYFWFHHFRLFLIYIYINTHKYPYAFFPSPHKIGLYCKFMKIW